jgi:endonuclease/exonuclease/phosphatase family metal-dependent hydrolase
MRALATNRAPASNAKAPRKTTVQRLAVVLSLLYPAAIAGIVLAFRYLGERYWPIAAALYLPRVLFAAPLPFLALALVLLKLHRWLWTQAAAALVLVFPLMGFVIAPPHAAKEGAPTIRLLSYNIDSGVLGVGGVVDEIERYAPDIVLLQEIAYGDEIAQLFAGRYTTYRYSGQFAIASRFRVVAETDPEKILYEGRTRSPRFMRYVLDTPLGPLVVYNIHPVSPREGLNALGGGGLRHKLLSGQLPTSFNRGRLEADVGLRRAQIEEAVQDAGRETLPVVIAGDTNLPGLSRILGDNFSGYQDAFTAAGSGFGYTFPVGRPWMRIDRVMATAAFRFTGFQIGHSTASDHHCVVADFQAR